ncbi:MAG: sn-glycerol-3-phosphate ABC transporter ATP-binding protein UgpC [Aquisalimonadaceae bacterium]
MGEVVLKQVRKAFGETTIIHGVDIEVNKGEFVVFVGPSGCGKSTLLRLIAGLEEISSGDMYVAGQRVNDTPASQRGIAMVFQSYALYPHMTVEENMGFSLKLAKCGKNEIKSRVAEAARILQIEHLLDRKPKDLSGGQRQRVAIGRAIVRKPAVFLFDEPLSNLDASLRVQMRIELSRLHDDLGATMIYVTHDQVEAMTLADRIVVLNGGRVEQVGAPLDLYHYPDNLFVATFIGSPKMNLIEGKLLRGDAGSATVRLPSGDEIPLTVDASGARVGSRVTIGIRPEHMVTGPSDTFGTIRGQVLVIERLGDSTLAHVQGEACGGDNLIVRLPGDSGVNEGDMLEIGLPPTCCHLFNSDGRSYRRCQVEMERSLVPEVASG